MLLAQGFDHLVQIGILHGGNRLLDLDGIQILDFDFRINFEAGGKDEVLAGFQFVRGDRRGTGRAQLLTDDGFDEVALDQRIGGIGSGHLAVHFFDHSQGRFARTEAIDATGLGQLSQASIDFFRYFLSRYCDGKTALKALGRLYRNLHSFTSFNSARRETPLLLRRSQATSADFILV